MASSPSSRSPHNHRASASKSPVSSRVASPLSAFPKFSPPTSRNTSPVRRPLHDRSNSQTNQFSGPTIRIVEDPGIDASDIYSKTPFPSQSSQILAPRKKPGYVFERRGLRVSDLSPVANAVAKIEAGQSLVPVPLHHRKAIRHSTSTSTSDADTIVASSFSPSSTRFSQGSTPPSSPGPDSWSKEKGLDILQEDITLSSPNGFSTIRTVPPSSSSSEDPLETHALTPRASAASLASTASTDTLSYHRDHQQDSSSISRPISKVPNYALSISSDSDQKKQASSTNTETQRLTSKVSRESFAYSDSSSNTNNRPRSSSQPSPTIHEAQHATLTSGVRISFPVVRAPSASSLWAQSQDLPTISSRMNNRASQVHHWSSQLSTIASESDRASRSFERRSQSIDGRYSHDDYAGNARGYTARRRQTIESIASSDNASSIPGTGSSVPVPLPLFSPITRPSQEERDLDEHHDTISPLQSPPIRKQRSGFLRRHDSDSRSSSSRPGSSQSDITTFIASTIPAWARVYYRRGERVSMGAPESMSDLADSRLNTAQSGRTNTPSDGHFPLSIYRPRNRPHERYSHPETMSISDDLPIEQEVYVIGRPRHPRTEIFTPRLRQDRRSQARLSAWKAPSFDDTLGTLFFSRQNRQILLFVFGFIFPFAWMIAAFLPLPINPDMVEPSPSQIDVERQFAREVGPLDDRSYQKALWWRNLNRIMAAIGTLLIGVIIALAILASRM